MLGSRLFWALGLAVDRDYPVRVRCHGCPPIRGAPIARFPADRAPRATREFDDAMMQRLYPAAVIETRSDEGWCFAELDDIDAAVGGAPRAEVDALRLLAAFVAHGDDKPDNQRLVCPFDAIDARPLHASACSLVADLGTTFGRGANPLFGRIDDEARPSFAAWSSLPMWEDARACRVHLSARVAPSHPIVSEAGRRFLAERLSALPTIRSARCSRSRASSGSARRRAAPTASRARHRRRLGRRVHTAPRGARRSLCATERFDEGASANITSATSGACRRL